MGAGDGVGCSQADLCTSAENDVADSATGPPEALAPAWSALTCEVEGTLPPLVLVKNKAKRAQEVGAYSCSRETLGFKHTVPWKS